MYVWRENDQVVRRCRWVMPHTSLTVDHFAVGACSLAVISNDGQAFTGNIPVLDRSQPSSPLSGEADFLCDFNAVRAFGLLLFIVKR